MPTAGKSAAADAKKKAAKSKDKEKKSSKDRADKTKKKSDDKPPKKKSEPKEPLAPAPAAPGAVDPDAVQLFRHYDRARAGAMLRSDFLQLLRDYAHLPRVGPHAASTTRRPPLSLTDSRGIPLGYERAEKNSEFEAGQLFERYDKAHVGALSLDAFGEFFRDFQAQLRGFVDDLSYSGASVHPLPQQDDVTPTPPPVAKPTPVAARPPLEESEKPTATEASPSSELRASVRAEYQATLWELRKICKDELTQQRERIRSELARLRDRLSSRVPRRDGEDDDDDGEVLARHAWRRREFDDVYSRRQSTQWSSWVDNQLPDRYDAMESDLERVDEVLRTTRRQLRKGLDASVDDMKAFLRSAPELLADARELAMKVYATDAPPPSRHERSEERSASPQMKNGRHTSPRDARQTETNRSRSVVDKSAAALEEDRRDSGDQATVAQLQKTLRIKDQLIYQLLQERTTLRRQKASVEEDLQDLSQVSTHEMRKWAQLTDEMQQEIALLRDRLSRLGDRRRDDDEPGYGYTQRHA